MPVSRTEVRSPALDGSGLACWAGWVRCGSSPGGTTSHTSRRPSRAHLSGRGCTSNTSTYREAYSSGSVAGGARAPLTSCGRGGPPRRAADLPPGVLFWKRGGRGARLYYLLWQAAALRRAQKLSRQVSFDLHWHLTW